MADGVERRDVALQMLAALVCVGEVVTVRDVAPEVFLISRMCLTKRGVGPEEVIADDLLKRFTGHNQPRQVDPRTAARPLGGVDGAAADEVIAYEDVERLAIVGDALLQRVAMDGAVAEGVILGLGLFLFQSREEADGRQDAVDEVGIEEVVTDQVARTVGGAVVAFGPLHGVAEGARAEEVDGRDEHRLPALVHEVGERKRVRVRVVAVLAGDHRIGTEVGRGLHVGVATEFRSALGHRLVDSAELVGMVAHV